MKLIKLFFIAIFLMSCNATFVPLISLNNDTVKKTFKLGEYDIYTFRLVSNQVNCDVKRDITKLENGLRKTKSSLVYEEIYLLLHKQNKSALYITTLSHKYIYKNGAFNHDYNDKEILFNNVELLYEGIYDDSKIIFYNAAHKQLRTLQIEYKKEGGDILFTKTPNNNPISKNRKKEPTIDLENIFSVKLVFVKDTYVTDEKETKYRYFTYFDGCNRLKVTTIYHDNSSIYFKISSNEKLTHPYRKISTSKDRVRYFIE